MVGALERLKDGALLVRTDKRLWSAGGFLFSVVLIWAMTTSWREDPPEKEKVVRVQEDKNDYMRNALADFQRDFEMRKQTRSDLEDVVKRTQSELAADRQQVDWHVNELMGKLDNMANRVDKLATKIGSRKLEEAEVDRKITAQSKKKRATKVDPGEM